MCGIYGLLDKTQTGFKDIDLNELWHMGIITQHRGIDSSGMFAVDLDAKKPSKIIKTTGPFTNLPYEKGYDAYVKYLLKSAGVIIGHGRYATVGKITKINAHPFKEGHITLVHNGTINDGLKHQTETEVDSHALCLEIKQKGFKAAFENIRGAYAVIAHDEQEGKVYITRNVERPLFYLEDHSKIYILSAKNALEFLQKEHRFSFANAVIKSFDPNRLYVFEDGKLHDSEELVEKKSYPSALWSWGEYYQKRDRESWKPSTSDSKEVYSPKYKYGDEISFKIVGFSEKNKEYTYLGKDEEGNTIYFKTSKLNEAWKGVSGTAKCNMVHSFMLNGEHVYQYQIKIKEIEWEEEDDDELVLIEGGEVLEKSKWKSICETTVCETCTNRINENDNEETAVWESGKRWIAVCKDCLLAGKHSGHLEESRLTTSDVQRLLQ